MRFNISLNIKVNTKNETRDSGDGKHMKQEADSGHNSLNTNRSAGSTISSKHSMGPIESHFPEMEVGLI